MIITLIKRHTRSYRGANIGIACWRKFALYGTLHSDFKEMRTVDTGQDYIVLLLHCIQLTTSSFTHTNVQILLIDIVY